MRLFHTPTRLPNDLAYTIALAQAAKQHDLKFLLNYHYSDTWADPGKQYVPKAWANLSHAQLVEVAYNCETAEYRDKLAPFPETPDGQRQFLDEVHRMVMNTPHNRGKGLFWWEPATRRGGGRTMFDPGGQALPVLTVFDKYTRY